MGDSAAVRLDPVLQFDSWLDQATPDEIQEAETKYEIDLVAYHKGRGREYILGSGERLYKHRAVIKRLGTRDWTDWVTKTLGMPRQTAYDHIRAWLGEYGHALKLDVHNEADRPNPKAEEIMAAIKAALQARKGLRRSTTAPQLENNVRVPWPEVRMTRSEIDRFKEMRERDPELFYELMCQYFYELSQQIDPQAEKVFFGTFESDDEIDLGLFVDSAYENLGLFLDDQGKA